MSFREWRPRLVSYAFRRHISYVLPAILGCAILAFGLRFAVPQSLVSVSGYLGGWTAAMAAAVLFHYGAYALTADAIRLKGSLVVEKNPVARFMFKHIGLHKFLWLSTGLILFLMAAYAYIVGPYLDFLVSFGFLFVSINAVDFINDVVAIKSRDYLLSHPRYGVPAKAFLPCPLFKDEDLTPFTIRAVWSAAP